MRDQLLQFGLVAAFGRALLRCGCLTAFVVTRNHWRDDMNQAWPRALQLADRQMGMGRAADI
jgi:hypothetical protein